MNQKNFTLLLFAVLFSVFSVLGFMLYSGMEETGEKKEWELHAVKVKENINHLRRLNINLESLNRGFVLSMDSLYVKNHEIIKSNLVTALADLDVLVKENVSQVHRVNLLKTDFQKRFKYVDSLRNMVNAEEGTKVISSLLLENKQINDEIEETCSFMLVEQDALLKMREDAFEEELSSNKSSLLGLVMGLLLILIAATLFLFRIFNQISAAKKLTENKNTALEITKKDLLSSNEALNTLSSQFESSLKRSSVAAFDWPDTTKESFWLSNSMFDMLDIAKDDFEPTVTDFFSKLMHPDDSQKVQADLEAHLKEDSMYNPEYRLKKKDGTYKYFRALASSSVENGVQSMTGVIIDIEDEIELRKSRDKMNARINEYGLRFDLVLKSSSYGVWDWYDTKNTHQWWSDSFYELIGYTPEEMDSTGQNFHALLHPDDAELTQKAIEDNIEFGTKINLEYRLNTKKLGYKWFRAVGNRIVDENEPNRIRMIGVVSDISKEKMSSEELKRSNADLQDFAYVASHDLQEPLRKIQAFGDRLKMYVEKEYPDFEGTVYINKMNNSATRMRTLIDDLLNFSRVSSESNFSDTVNLNEVLTDVKELLSETISTGNVSFETDDLPTIHEANKSNLTQLFQNLVSNAIKFRKEDVAPKINIKSTIIGVDEAIKYSPLLNVHENYFKIEIKDNGIGFDENYLKKIFTIFQRLHGRSEYKGTGIGLAVCQKICENHEGFITANSKEGEGATFVVILPKLISEK